MVGRMSPSSSGPSVDEEKDGRAADVLVSNDGPIKKDVTPLDRPQVDSPSLLAIEAQTALLGGELRSTVHTGLQNIGILAAFMTALAGQIYASAPSNPRCLGQTGVTVILILEWFAMGFFFAAMATSIVLALDIDGVGDRQLPLHLRQASFVFTFPYLATAGGMVLMPIGYGFDLGERNGCLFSILGVVVALLFPLFVFLVGCWVRRRRRQLHRDGGAGSGVRRQESCSLGTQVVVGRTSMFTPYLDRIPPRAWLQRWDGVQKQELRAQRASLMSTVSEFD